MVLDNNFYERLKEVEMIPFSEVVSSLGGRMLSETKFEMPQFGEKTPSCSIYYKNGKEYFSCFGRNIHGDKVDLVAFIYNCSLVKAVELILGKSSYKKLEQQEIHKFHQLINEKEEKKKREALKSMKMLIKNSTLAIYDKNAMEYFKKRALFDVVSSFNSKGIKILFNEYKGFKSIVYDINREHHCCIQKSIYKDEKGDRYIHNYAPEGMEIAYLYRNRESSLMITEGMEDGLSSLAFNINSISLNSANNVGKLIEIINKNVDKFRRKKIYLGLDNDNAGRLYAKELKKCLKNNNISYTDTVYILEKEKVKDINELLIKKQKRIK